MNKDHKLCRHFTLWLDFRCYVLAHDDLQAIPYAAAPVGERRFLPPVPPAVRAEPLNTANQNLTICPQVSRALLPATLPSPFCFDGHHHQVLLGALVERSSEDCLYLAVHSPDLESESLLPVMVAHCAVLCCMLYRCGYTGAAL